MGLMIMTMVLSCTTCNSHGLDYGVPASFYDSFQDSVPHCLHLAVQELQFVLTQAGFKSFMMNRIHTYMNK